MHPPVDAELYRAVEAVCGKGFAFSYLVKAGQRGKRLYPYTVTAWERLTMNGAVRDILKRQGVWLEKPEPFYEGRRFMGDTDQQREAA